MARHRIFFATNRMPEKSGSSILGFTDEVGPIGGNSIRFGSVEIDVRDPFKDEVNIVDGSFRLADENLVAGKTTRVFFGSKQVFEEIRKAALGGACTDIICFIHGFNNGWEDAIKRAGVIADLYGNLGNGRKAMVFAFTWPSTGEGIFGIPVPFKSYEHDRRSVARSGIAAARTIEALRNYVSAVMADTAKKNPNEPKADLCDARLHLLVHSMGHQVLSETLKALPGILPAGAGRVFDEAVLVAADESADALDGNLPGNADAVGSLYPLIDLARRITVYTNEDDWILDFLSEETKGNDRRLGIEGPTRFPFASKISTVDCTDVLPFGKDIQNHQYYRKIEEVRDDIRQVLSGAKHQRILTSPSGKNKREQISSQQFRLV